MKSGKLLVLGAIILAGSVLMHAQTLPPTTADDQMGLQPYQSYHGGDIDHVSLSNGTLNLDYPFLSYSQRGQLQLSFHLYYNNQPQHFAQLCGTPSSCRWIWGYNPAPSALPIEKGDVFVGWAQQMGFTFADSDVVLNPGKSDQITYHYSNWSLQTADGAKHPLGNLGSKSWIQSVQDFFELSSGPFETLDATGLRLNASLSTDDYGTSPPLATEIVGPDGALGGTQDANGNIITVNSTGFTDTLGRQVPLPPTARSTSNIDMSGCPQSPLATDHAVSWSVPAPNGGTASYKFCYAVVSINIPGGGDTLPNSGTSMQLQSIVLPDGHTWNFQYNDPGDGSTYNGSPVNYGTLTQVTLPTGGTISYAYTNTGSGAGGINCQNSGRFVANRTVNSNDGTGAQKSNYSYSTASTGNSSSPWTVTTTVTDPLGNYAVHTFNALYAQDYCPAYENQTQYFQSGGTLLKTVNTTYSFTQGDNKNGPLNVVPTQITAVWPNGKTETVTRSYDSGFTYTSFKGGTGIPAIYGKVVSDSASDYGSNGAGATLRTTNTNYLALSNSSYLTANLLDLVSSKTVSDGSGCKLAETDYTYDESSSLTSYTGTLPPGTHGAPPNSVRGNPTTVTQQLFATSTCPTTAQAGPARHTNWYDTGEVYQTIDPLGNTTTHAYDSAYAGAYPTKTTNALNQNVTGAYDFNTGLLTSFTDANGNTTSFAFDSMRRVTSIVFPKGSSGNQPQTTFTYSAASAGFPVTVQRSKSVTTILSDSVTTALDGLGRVSQTQHATPNGNATVGTTYDADGRVSSVTNPYFAPSDPTYGVTSTQYDGIGRVIKTTKQDNSTVTAQYNQSAATSANADCAIGTDEAGNQRQSCTDGIGRLVEVDESGNAYAGSAASGSIGLGSIRQNVQSFPATYGTGQFTVDGTEQQTVTCIGGRCRTTWDNGSIKVNLGGFIASTNASQFATAGSIANALANQLAASGSVTSSLYSSSSTSATYTLTAVNPGPQAIPISYGGTSISFSSSGSSTVSGGQNASTLTTYDAGTVTASVNGGFSATVCYGQSSNGFCSGKPVNSTTDQVGAALAQALSAQGSPVNATYSGGTLSIAYATVGFAGNVPVTISSNPDNPNMFPGGSFSGSATLTGGSDPYPSGLAHPYITLYSYDVLGNLTQVNQKGDGSQTARVRTFTYDSLSRLTQAVNPESGTINYTYDADGNLLQKTSPAPNQTGTATQVISYCYDALNRVTGRAYSAQSCPLSSPVVTYTYDGGTNGIGHLTSLTDQAGSGGYSYDALGRMTLEQRTIAGISKTVSYGYYLDNSLQTLTYPSGAVVTYTPWNNGTNAVAGAAQALADNSNSINYVSLANYQADGQITAFTSGSAGIANTFSYNNRLQPIKMSAASPSQTVFSIGYDFHLSNGDNGNVWGITNNKDNTRNQSFTYDTLNRLTSAQNAGTNCAATTVNGKSEYWGNSYGYDAWGNLLQKTITKCGAEHLNVTADPQNRTHVTAGADYQYDAAGNMTYDTSGLYYSYDQENRIIGAAGYTYTYDGDGNRVEKSNGSTGTFYWYMSPGIVGESDLSGNLTAEYVFFDGARVARKDFPGNAISYYFSDHLKTASVITDSTGNIKAESDYYPWGGELQFLNNDTNHYKFTGKERDSETGLDYFGKRFYSNGLGRWTSPDPKGIALRHLLNPQKLNKYSYVLNNPTGAFDPDGMEEVTIQLRAFIPPASVAGFRGDNRSFSADKNASSRTSVTVRIETDPAKNHGNPMIGQPQIQISPTHLNLTGSEKTSTGPKPPEVKATQDKNGNVTVNVQENMRNPFTPVGGGIQENVNITVNQNATTAEFNGQVSGSPAFEGNVTVDGGQTQNVPLQDAPTNAVSFGLGLQKTNDIDKKVDLPQPKKKEDQQ